MRLWHAIPTMNSSEILLGNVVGIRKLEVGDRIRRQGSQARSVPNELTDYQDEDFVKEIKLI